MKYWFSGNYSSSQTIIRYYDGKEFKKDSLPYYEYSGYLFSNDDSAQVIMGFDDRYAGWDFTKDTMMFESLHDSSNGFPDINYGLPSDTVEQGYAWGLQFDTTGNYRDVCYRIMATSKGLKLLTPDNFTDAITRNNVDGSRCAVNVPCRIMLSQYMHKDKSIYTTIPVIVKWNKSMDSVTVDTIDSLIPKGYTFEGDWGISNNGTWARCTIQPTDHDNDPYNCFFKLSDSFPLGISKPIIGGQGDGIFVEHDSLGTLFIDPSSENGYLVYKMADFDIQRQVH